MDRAVPFLLIILSLTMLPGCWDYRDLDSLALPIVGLYDLKVNPDTGKKEMNVGAILPVLNPDASEKYRIDFETGKTVGETREKRNLYTPENYAIGLVQVAILSESLAKTDFELVTDNLYRLSEVKHTVHMAVQEGNIEDLSKLQLKGYPNPGIFLMQLLSNAQQSSFLPGVSLHDFAEEVYSAGKNPVLPLLKMTNNSRLSLSGTGIFKRHKLIAKIGLAETRSLVMLRGLEGEGYIPFEIKENGKVTDVGTVLVQRSRKVKVKRNGNDFNFYVTINLAGRLIEHTSYGKPRSFIGSSGVIPLSEVEKTIKEEVEKECQKFVQKMQTEFRVDCIDINKYALARWRTELNDEIEKDEFIEKAKIVVNVEVKITNIGEKM